MAQKVPDYDWGDKPDYDWDGWLDGVTTRLKKGEDFLIEIRSLRAMAHSKAKTMGIRVQTHKDEDDPDVIWIQALKD